MFRWVTKNSLRLGVVLGLSFISIFALQAVSPPKVSAAYNGAYLIDNATFLNATSMSPSQIQSFLVGKNSGLANLAFKLDCAAAGAQGAQWYAAVGAPCGQNVAASSIIYYSAQVYGVSPKVIMTTMQKEQSLITAPSPTSWQLNQAMGYACPDSGNCSASSSFFFQVDNGTWALRFHYERANGNNSWWYNSTSWVCGVPKNYYKPNLYPYGPVQFFDDNGTNYTTLTLANAATSAFYCYTPHAYNNPQGLYGLPKTNTGGQYYSGSYNFVSYYESWFGPTTNDRLAYSVIQGPNSPALYLETPAGKYYLPSGEIMKAWKLDTLPIRQVSQAYINSLPEGPWVSNLLKDDWNNYFVVDGGSTLYVRDSSYLVLWGLSPNDAVQSLGVTSNLTPGSWLGRFVQDKTQPAGQLWLIDNGKKHLIPTSMLYQWRYTPDQLTTVSTSFLSSIPVNPNNVTSLASDGSSSYVVDSGRKLSVNDAINKDAYYGSKVPVVYASVTLSYLPNDNTVSRFVVDSSTGQWFMLEGGNKHYITSADIATLWGKPASSPLTYITPNLMMSLPSAGNLTNVVQTPSPSMYWVVDGSKHYISTSDVANAWLASGQSPPTYSAQSLSMLPRSSDATSTINASGSPYTYIMDAGVKRFLSTPGARSGLGGAVMTTTGALVNSIPEGSFLNFVVKDAGGQAYLIMNGSRYTIDPAYYASWGVASAQVIATTTLSRYSNSGVTLQSFIKIGGTSYVMSNGNKLPIQTNYDAYQPQSLGQTTLSSDYFNTGPQATYLLRSNDPQDSRVWLMSGGQKYLFSSFAAYVSYGYLSRGLAITYLPPAALNSIPTGAETPGLFIRTANSWGIKFISFGTSLGFPDGDTLFSLLGSSPVLVVSDSIYNNFPLAGSISKILKDDSGRIYLVQNGTKHWITNSRAYDPYRSIPVTYLYGTTMSLIPDGPAIN